MHATFIYMGGGKLCFNLCEDLSISVSPLLLRYSSSGPQPKARGIYQGPCLWWSLNSPLHPVTHEHVRNSDQPLSLLFQISLSESVLALTGKAVLHVTLTFLCSSLLPDADPANSYLLMKSLMHLNNVLKYILLTFSYFSQKDSKAP